MQSASSEAESPARRPQALIMTQPPTQPPLNPQFCFNERVLRDFLRVSRSSIDDSITQNLNALITPSATSPFTADSTFTRTPSRAAVRPPIDQSACTTFMHNVLFPSWQVRSDVITYCGGVAASPDPDDPTTLERGIEHAKDKERLVNERLDPYSARSFPTEARTERLASVIRNEQRIEGIIRQRTWNVVMDRCARGIGEEGWERAMDKWREGT